MSHRQSSLKAWRRCPAAYRLLYIDGHAQEENGLMQAGTWAHAVYAQYADHCRKNSVSTDTSVLPRLARECWDDERASAADRKSVWHLNEANYDDLVRELIVPFGEIHLFGHEFRSELKIGIVDSGRLVLQNPWFHGTLDLVEKLDDETGAYRLTDYKTGWSPEADPVQLKIYAWLLMTVNPRVQTVEAQFDYIRFNVQRGETFTRDELPVLDAEIRTLVNRVEADNEWRPTPGPQCLDCNVAAHCPARLEIPNAITSDDEARQAVESLALMERDVKGLKEQLRAWCVEHGNVAHNGIEWGFHRRGSEGFSDVARFVEVAKSAEVNPWPYLSVNNTKTKKLQRDERFAGLLENRATIAFSGQKAGIARGE